MPFPARTVARHRVVRRLMDAGAITADAARPLPDLSDVERRGLARLRELGAVHEAAPGAYWLDHERFAEYRHHRRIVILAVIAILIALFFVVELRGLP